MQVFEYFIYNLKQIRFKDTKDYFDELLKTISVEYSDIAFQFNAGSRDDRCEKTIKKFPELAEYKLYIPFSARYAVSQEEYFLSSVRGDSDGKISTGIKPQHKEAFCELLKKIPNTINFSYMGVVLDKVDWDGTGVQSPVFYSNSEIINTYTCNGFSCNFDNYFSNSIRFFKDWSCGNKINEVKIMIERQIENDILVDYPDSFKKVLEHLGKSKYSFLCCVFDDVEKKRWVEASKTFEEVIEHDRKTKNYVFSGRAEGEKQDDYIINSVTPVGGFSPKKAFGKYAKPNGYKYVSCVNGRYEYKKVNSNNHAFKAFFLNIPLSSLFEVSIEVEGYNFKHWICTTQTETVKTVDDAELYAEKVFEIASNLEKKYTEELLNNYGKTPFWYVN